MTKYRMTSTAMFYTPGMVKWGINGYAFEDDRTQILKVFVDGYSLPPAAAHALLNKDVPYTIEGEPGMESVVFEHE